MYATLEPDDSRYFTTQEQQFSPLDKSKLLLPLAFCRECGQEYYTVYVGADGVRARRLNDTSGNDDEQSSGFLYASLDKPWPTDEEELLSRVPDDWLEPYAGGERIKKAPKTAIISARDRLEEAQAELK